MLAGRSPNAGFALFRVEILKPLSLAYWIVGQDDKSLLHKIEDYILVGKRAWNAELNRDNSLLFVANGLSDDVSIIDVAKRKVIKSIPVMRVPHTVLIDD